MVKSPEAIKIESNALFDAAKDETDRDTLIALTAAAQALQWVAGDEDGWMRPSKLWGKEA